jgi:hypothetical protein
MIHNIFIRLFVILIIVKYFKILKNIGISLEQKYRKLLAKQGEYKINSNLKNNWLIINIKQKKFNKHEF